MAKTVDDRYILFLILLGFLVGLIVIVIFLFPLILKFCCCRWRKKAPPSDDREYLLKSSSESLSSNYQTKRRSRTQYEDTEIDCAIEYRTRGTQLIIGIANIVLSSSSWAFLQESADCKIFLLVYIEGDILNSPCESKKHNLDRKIFFNEIFILTVMPYDLVTLKLVVKVVFLCDQMRYSIGNMVLPLDELNNRSFSINKIYKLQFPNELTLISDCLLSLSILKSINTIKLNIGKLYFLDGSLISQSNRGIHVRIQMTDFQSPLQVFDTEKRKLQRCITFNQTFVFQFTADLNSSLELEIQIVESSNAEESEVAFVCGHKVLYAVQNDVIRGFEVPKVDDDHLLQALINQDAEIIRWHQIWYDNDNQ